MCVRRRDEEQWFLFIYVKTYYLIWGFNPGGWERTLDIQMGSRWFNFSLLLNFSFLLHHVLKSDDYKNMRDYAYSYGTGRTNSRSQLR
jgi:hypothetical protein